MPESMLRIPADVTRLAELRQFVRTRAHDLGADADVANDVAMAVDELATNSILHGYGGLHGAVEVEMGRSADAIVIRLRDQAPPFDPCAAPQRDTSLPLAQRPLGGMGIQLSRSVCDELSYRRTAGGNELTITKRLPRGNGGGTC